MGCVATLAAAPGERRNHGRGSGGVAGRDGALVWVFRDPHDFNRRSTLWHLATDSAGFFGVLLAAAVLWWTGWTPINAAVTLLIAILMTWGGWGVVHGAGAARSRARLDPTRRDRR